MTKNKACETLTTQYLTLIQAANDNPTAWPVFASVIEDLFAVAEKVDSLKSRVARLRMRFSVDRLRLASMVPAGA